MKLSEHFTLEELTISDTAVRKGISNLPTEEHQKNLVEVAHYLEYIRDHYQLPIRVSSGYRSEALNKAVGGSKTSAHCSGCAVDFTIPGIANIEVCKWIEANVADFDQVIYEFGPKGWVHLGLGANPRKQSLTAIKGTNNRTMYKPGIVDLWS